MSIMPFRVAFSMAFLAFTVLFAPVMVAAQEPIMDFVRAEVEGIIEVSSGGEYPLQEAQLRILSGPESGDRIAIKNELFGNREDLRMAVGQTVVLQRIERPDGSKMYSFQEHYRLPALFIAFVLFLLLGALIGRKRGVMSLIGLGISILIIVFVIFPLMIAGWNAFAVSIVASFLIAGSTILISHGYNKRTMLALSATCITLVISILLAVFTVAITKLFGLGSEESVFLQLDPSIHIDPKGLLLAGIVIGALGVLDDVTTTQVSAVHEVHKANPSYTFAQLFSAGTSVGREHVASMINTLVLAYAGASLPLFLLFSLSGDVPMWVTVNSAFLAEEIVRTLVGSAALLLAVPIATFLAAYGFSEH